MLFLHPICECSRRPPFLIEVPIGQRLRWVQTLPELFAIANETRVANPDPTLRVEENVGLCFLLRNLNCGRRPFLNQLIPRSNEIPRFHAPGIRGQIAFVVVGYLSIVARESTLHLFLKILLGGNMDHRVDPLTRTNHIILICSHEANRMASVIVHSNRNVENCLLMVCRVYEFSFTPPMRVVFALVMRRSQKIAGPSLLQARVVLEAVELFMWAI